MNNVKLIGAVQYFLKHYKMMCKLIDALVVIEPQ
jgi:hypothetical protein